MIDHVDAMLDRVRAANAPSEDELDLEKSISHQDRKGRHVALFNSDQFFATSGRELNAAYQFTLKKFEMGGGAKLLGMVRRHHEKAEERKIAEGVDPDSLLDENSQLPSERVMYELIDEFFNYLQDATDTTRALREFASDIETSDEQDLFFKDSELSKNEDSEEYRRALAAIARFQNNQFYYADRGLFDSFDTSEDELVWKGKSMADDTILASFRELIEIVASAEQRRAVFWADRIYGRPANPKTSQPELKGIGSIQSVYVKEYIDEKTKLLFTPQSADESTQAGML